MKLKEKIVRSKAKKIIDWLQHLLLLKEDVFIAGYPKSGSTWFRFILYELITNSEASFEKSNYLIPSVGRHFIKKIKTNHGRFIQTHHPYNNKYKKAIYIVRDPRDVIISEFHYNKKMGFIPMEYEFDLFFKNFHTSQVNRYGNYSDNVSSWIDAAKNKKVNILFVRYEDMKADTLKEFIRINDFLNLNLSREILIEKIENNDINRMREKEISSKDKTLAKKGSKIPFVRKGEKNDWFTMFGTEKLTIIELKYKNILDKFHYK
ncbi:sulfotransferase domain-containing protein [Crocinitomicaceae bacterium]|nr:sulfotransferase domain-containing protein [Crocinitomicaceae bacterium]